MTACADCHFNTPDYSSSSNSGSSSSSSGSGSATNNHLRWNRQAERALRDKDLTPLEGIDNQLFTTHITHFEIDVAYLHANQHFNSAQIWANLEKKYAGVDLITGERNEKRMRGLFPRLISLECNHWLPSPHFLRLLRGIPTDTSSAAIVSTSTSSTSSTTRTRTTSMMSSSNNPSKNAQSSSMLPLHLSLSPGMSTLQILSKHNQIEPCSLDSYTVLLLLYMTGVEDPCSATFLHAWDHTLLPIHTLLLRR